MLERYSAATDTFREGVCRPELYDTVNHGRQRSVVNHRFFHNASVESIVFSGELYNIAMKFLPKHIRNAQFFRTYFGAPFAASEAHDTLRVWQARVLHSLFLTALILGFLTIVPSVWLSMREGLYPVALFDCIAYILLVVLFVSRKISYSIRAMAISILVYLVGLILFLVLGPSGAGPIWLFAFPVITGVLLGFRAAVASLSLNCATLVAFGLALLTGHIGWAYPVVNPMAKWVVICLNFMLLNSLATISLTSILKGLQEALSQEKLLRKSLLEKHAELEDSHRNLQKEIAEKEVVLKELGESDQKVLLLAENALDCIWQMDRDLRFTYVNPAVRTILGYLPEEWIGTRATDHCPPDEVNKTEKAINELYGSSRSHGFLAETRWRHKDGHFVPVEILSKQLVDHEGTVIGLQGSTRDISERKVEEERRKELEDQVRRSQKLESIGTLAGGIAHDFNNILSSVIGYTELALYDMEKGSVLEGYLNEVHTAGLRAKELVKQILAFSRRSDQEKKPVQVSLLVKEVVKMLRSTISTTIDIKHSIRSSSLVMADPTQIHQVLMNLCTNASHAMEESGGTLEIEVSDTEIDRAFTKEYPDLQPGHYLKVRVSDSGTGISPAILGAIFEPYFTTKEPGRGTGLGLSVVHGIVKGHNGEITVESEPGKGSTFQVYFPVLERQAERETEAAEEIPTGGETILLVDDEAPIVSMGKKFLERMGYTVMVTTSSREALELFRATPDLFDLVITDMNMPKMAGDKLSGELLKIRPDIPIVLCTGFSQRLTTGSASAIGAKGILMKPYVMSQLAKVVRSVLDEYGSGTAAKTATGSSAA